MKRAFTLIELLVVIAIIAILAAILFPVFAQAKLAAKKTASLSNAKEIGLSQIMYGGDADDNFVLMATENPKGGGLFADMQTTPAKAVSWVVLLQPYIKNYQIMVDPGVGDSSNIFGSGTNATVYNQERLAQYGYNYMFLSPWNACMDSLSRSQTSGVNPANTVMFSTSQAFSQTSPNGYFMANAPGAWPIILPAPNACIIYSGAQGSGNWSTNPGLSVGKMTSSVRATKPYGGSPVVWVDGHAKFMNDSALAIGTDYASAVYTNSNSGAQITDITKYLWSLDGTTNDLSF